MLTSECADAESKGLVLPWLVGCKNNKKAPVKTVMTNNEAESNTLLPHDDNGKPPEDKGNKSDEGNMDKNGNGKAEINKDAKSKNNSDTKPAAKNNPEKEPNPGRQKNSIKTGNNDSKCNFQATVSGKPLLPLSKNGNNNKWKQNVEPLIYILDVTVPKFPLIGGQGYGATHNVKVMFKDPDPEIVYPTYQIGEAVYVGDKSHSGLVYGYISEPYEGYDAYSGYQVLIHADDGKVVEQGYSIYAISDIVQFYNEEPGKDEAWEGGNNVKGQSGKVQRNNKGNSSSHFSLASFPFDNNNNTSRFTLDSDFTEEDVK
eukprot:jgi/Psemu1/18190/gm1.18190_g